MNTLSNTVERKFINSIDIDDYEIRTEDGWENIEQIHKTIEYIEYIITLDNGMTITCADTHIMITDSYTEIYAKDSLDALIRTTTGISKVMVVGKTNKSSNMYDISISGNKKTYYTNGILSHNTTTAVAYILHFIIFNESKNVGIFANKQSTSIEILGRLQLAYGNLPWFLQVGVISWGKKSIELENLSKVSAWPTTGSAGRSGSYSMIIIDEMAFVHKNMWDDFWESVYPTVSSGKKSKVILISTPKGLNHFYKMFTDAQNGVNEFKHYTVKWDKVPGRDEAWKIETIANSSEKKFEQEHNVSFLGSSNTLISASKLQEIPIQPVLSETDSGLRIYKEPVDDHIYAIIVDVSKGKGLDYSICNTIDITSYPFEQVAIFRSNNISHLALPSVINTMYQMYDKQDCYVLVENNSGGGGEEVNNIILENYDIEGLLPLSNKKYEYGYNMNKKSKSIGCATAKELIESDKLIIVDDNTIGEMSTFVEKGYSYQAEGGHNDDIAMTIVGFGYFVNHSIFSELTNMDFKAKMVKETDDAIMEEVIPFGFIDDGLDDDESLWKPVPYMHS